MKIWIVLVFGFIGLLVNAQEVTVNGSVYKVEKETIFKDGIDVGASLSEEEKAQIIAARDRKAAMLAASQRAEKQVEKAEKEQKRAEKKQKKAEKELKQKKKAQSRFDKSEKKYEDAVKKYEKLKGKGKLSPEDEEKWLEKIGKYQKANTKAKRKLKRA